MTDSSLPPKFPAPVEAPPAPTESSGPDPRIFTCVRISGFFSLISIVFWAYLWSPAALLAAVTFAHEVYYLVRSDEMNRKEAHSFALRVAVFEIATGIVTFCSPPSLICGLLVHRFAAKE